MTYIDPLNGGATVGGTIPAAGSPAEGLPAGRQGKKEKPVRILANAAPPPETAFHQSCLVPQLSPVEYHFCILEANWQTLEQTRRKAFENTVEILDGSLGLVDKKPKGILQWIKEFAFSESRKIYFQADNWTLLEASKKAWTCSFSAGATRAT